LAIVISEHCISINHAEWEWLIAGVNWQRLAAKPTPDWQVKTYHQPSNNKACSGF